MKGYFISIATLIIYSYKRFPNKEERKLIILVSAVLDINCCLENHLPKT